MTARHDVLVVGAAVTGLSTAVFLAAHGVKPLVVERHPDTLSHPRSRGINPRTAELYRQLGLEDRLWAEASLATDFSKLLMLRAGTVAGEEIFSAPTDQPDPTGSVSPCEWVPIDQDRLEHVLRDAARELGVEILFGTEAVGIGQDADGVDVVLRDRADGGERTVRASYVVAADGGRSPVRSMVGVGMDGPGEFATSLSLLFEADLSAALRGRPVGVCYLDRPSPQTVLFAHDGHRRWIFATAMPPGRDLADLTDGECADLVRAAVGQDDLEVTIVPQLPAGGAKALTFWIGAQVAQRYREGRVLLVGDAAHLVPPTGGFGASLGIQDGHNLAWKLAAVLSGTAAPELLDTYDAERRPVAWMTLQQTMAMMQERTGPDGDADGSGAADDGYATTVFGYRYGPGAPVAPAQLSGEPGTRAPHVTLPDGRSALDLFGRGLVLVTGPGADGWDVAAAGVADLTGAPVAVHRGDDGFAAAYGLGAGGAALVRPDGFVAWRCGEPPADPAAALLGATRALLLPAPQPVAG
jgi:putative polyketide hydroxylase